jgi:quercetin dioxygenase-like cupin family protein
MKPMTAAAALSPLLNRAGTARCYDMGDHTAEILLSSEETGGQFALIAGVVQPGGGPPPHVHEREDEMFHILSGRFEAWTEANGTVIAEPGDTLFAPRGIAHAWRNISDEVGRIIAVVTPGGFEKMFADMEPLVQELKAKGGVPGPDDFARIGAAMGRYAVRPVQPGIK